MKIFARLFRSFFNIEKRTSEAQLRDDFGVFPPVPLRSSGLAGDFDLVRTRGIGEAYHSMVMTRRMMDGVEMDPETLSADVKALMGDEIRAMRQACAGYKGNERVKRLAMSLSLGMKFVKDIYLLVRSGPSNPDALGVFLPLRKHEPEIVIKAGRQSKSKVLEAAVISHEHLHMLQHQYPRNHTRAINWSQEQIFSESNLAGDPNFVRHLLSILLEVEAEARLHELVLSFYRTHGHLPVTLPGFLGLLCASKQMGWLAASSLDIAGINFEVYAEYEEREASFIVQLESAIIGGNDDFALPYIAEALPVMYGNLLRYYGDSDASRAFLLEVPRPNFFDELYGMSPEDRAALADVPIADGSGRNQVASMAG